MHKDISCYTAQWFNWKVWWRDEWSCISTDSSPSFCFSTWIYICKYSRKRINKSPCYRGSTNIHDEGLKGYIYSRSSHFSCPTTLNKDIIMDSGRGSVSPRHKTPPPDSIWFYFLSSLFSTFRLSTIFALATYLLLHNMYNGSFPSFFRPWLVCIHSCYFYLSLG